MQLIRIGTCVPGPCALDWTPHMLKAGFECVAINFHMSTEGTDIKQLAEKLDTSGNVVSSIGFYCNPLQEEEHRRTLEFFIDNAKLFGTSIVSTFAGGLEGRSVPDCMPKYKEVFSELAKRAEDNGVKLVIENCPMGGNWHSVTCNIGFNPKVWEMMFNEVPSEAIGLEWEPGHQMIQLIDPVAQLKKWTKKVYHIHGKDASVDMDMVKTLGVFGTCDFAPERTPGLGDADWQKICGILYNNGYTGDICVEGYHDPIFNGSFEMTGQMHALNYLRQCRGGDFVANPWEA
ncbi:MAG: sugar phosphate isomerase/epimerase family protein [Eubacteriales bacterium]